MDLDNYKFRYDAYKNNTFDLDVVEKSINDSKLASYQYLRQFQLDSTGYKRFDFNMNFWDVGLNYSDILYQGMYSIIKRGYLKDQINQKHKTESRIEEILMKCDFSNYPSSVNVNIPYYNFNDSQDKVFDNFEKEWRYSFEGLIEEGEEGTFVSVENEELLHTVFDMFVEGFEDGCDCDCDDDDCGSCGCGCDCCH